MSRLAKAPNAPTLGIATRVTLSDIRDRCTGLSNSGSSADRRAICARSVGPGDGCSCADCSRATATARDRKSTRLNSSHDQISYAVFCLKKKKKKQPIIYYETDPHYRRP